MAIKCCNGCVPPKRTPGCHGTCKEYIAEKAALDEQNAAATAKKKTNQNIYAQKSAGVHRAKRRNRWK